MFFPGPWDAVVVPASIFFSTPELRTGAAAQNVLVYGPGHLLRAAWHSGITDYLRDPWPVEELFLRLRGPRPSFLEWEWGASRLQLEGVSLGAGWGTKIRLSTTEADLLRILVQRRGSPVSRPVLAWAADCSSGRVIDTLIGRLRLKIQEVTGRSDNPLVAVRGLGYRFP